MQIAPRFHSQNGRWIDASIDDDHGGGGGDDNGIDDDDDDDRCFYR